MDKAVITGCYADLKLIKTRSVAQVVIEVPIEQAQKAIDTLGLPLPGQEIHVAIARLNTAEAPPKKSNHKLSQQAALRCDEPAFEKFLQEEYGNTDASPADMVRAICEIDSRSELDRNEQAAMIWRNIEREYQAWLRM